MIAVQAELTQAPFDMPIAESELVAGYMTEYSGFRFLIFFIGEFATAGVFALIAVGAVPRRLGRAVRWFDWTTIDSVDDWMNVAGPLIMFTKMMLLAFIIMWVRFSVPPVPRGSAAALRLEGADPALARQHRRDGDPEGGCLMARNRRFPVC